MRYEQVKKRLWQEALIVVVLMAVLGSITYYLMIVFDEDERNSKQLETQVNTLVATMNTLRDKFSLVQKNSELYQEVLRKNANDGLNVNRDLIREKFKQYNTDYLLSANSTNMDPPQEMTGPNYKRGELVMVSSEIRSHFSALIDEDVYTMMQTIPRDLTGVIKFRRVAISRKGMLNDEMLSNIRKNGRGDLVDTNIEFLWMGIAKPQDNNNLKPAAPVAGRPSKKGAR